MRILRCNHRVGIAERWAAARGEDEPTTPSKKMAAAEIEEGAGQRYRVRLDSEGKCRFPVARVIMKLAEIGLRDGGGINRAFALMTKMKRLLNQLGISVR